MGTHQMSHTYGDSSGHIQGWAVDEAGGQFVIAGHYRGSHDLGGGPLPWAIDWNVFLLKVDLMGNHVWSQGFGDPSGKEYCRSVAIDSNGKIVIAGQFNSWIDFGGGMRSSGGGFDGFVAHFGSSGSYEWDVTYGDSAEQQGRMVAVDSSNRVIIASWFQGTVDLTLYGCGLLSSAGGRDILLARFTSTGTSPTCDYAMRFGASGDEIVDALAVDSGDFIVLGGYFSGTANFGGATNVTSAGGYDVFVARYSSQGVYLWSRTAGDTAVNQVGVRVATASTREIYFTGYFDGSLNFGGSTLTSGGGVDAFLASYAP
jgi:hypothetical protein